MSIKTAQGDGNVVEEKGSCVSWSKDGQVQALRVEAEATYVFPYSHLVFVRLSVSEREEELRISLSTHDVLVHGRNLREVALAFQKLAVEWIMATPARYAPLKRLDSAHIERIEVIELEPRDQTAAGEGESKSA
ncbi:MAG: hypothetical protein ABI680_00625 [Chthoniobacteraceae bacterium]